METITSSLLDFGALGLFAGFLIWQHTKNTKRLDETVESFQQTVRDQEAAHSAAEELIRNRYDNVIARHEEKQSVIYADVVKKLDDHGRILEDVHASIRGMQAQRLLDPTSTHLD
tara:strand:- start:1734 stop:2078 length:345 start_codon:yes stop_codon:yes gene_type:complete